MYKNKLEIMIAALNELMNDKDLKTKTIQDLAVRHKFLITLEDYFFDLLKTEVDRIVEEVVKRSI